MENGITSKASEKQAALATTAEYGVLVSGEPNVDKSVTAPPPTTITGTSPKRNGWNELKTLDKVTYIAQLTAIFSLLPTVLFAWLGWREAHLARSEQIAFFTAQNAPDLEVSASLDTSHVDRNNTHEFVDLKIKNTGGSPAEKISITLIDIKDNHTIRSTSSKSEEHLFGGLIRRMSLAKGKTLSIPLIGHGELESILKYPVASVRVFHEADVLQKNENARFLLLVVCEDRFGDQHVTLEKIAVTSKIEAK